MKAVKEEKGVSVALTQTVQPPSIQKGPVEGMLLIDGRPAIERADMPTISLDFLMKYQQKRPDDKGT